MAEGTFMVWEFLPSAVAGLCIILGLVAIVKLWECLRADNGNDDVIGRLGKPWRRCGSLEVCTEIFHTERNGKLLDANVMILESLGKICAADVRKALEMLMKRYQTLRMRYVNGSERSVKYFVEMENALVDFMQLDNSDWVPVLEKELKTLFHSSNGPLWRVRMLESREEDGIHRVPLVFSFHHGLLDGISIMKVYKEFLGFMDAIAAGDEPTFECIPLSPSLDTCLGIKPWGRVVLSIASLGIRLLLRTRFRPDRSPKMISNFLAACRPSEPDHTTTVHPIAFSAEETRRILAKSKEMGVTVHGTCTASAAVAFQKLLLNHGAIKEGEECRIPSGFNVSLRRLAKVPIPEESLGVCISFGSLPITVARNLEAANSFWDTAKQTVLDIKKSIDNGSPLFGIKMTQMLPYLFSDDNAELLEAREPFNAFNISNRGNFTFAASGRLEGKHASERPARYKLGETYWATAEHQGTMHLFVHNIATVNGKMSWSLVNYKHLVDREVAEEYAGLIKETITRACA
jgi:NRPS condensation-like uncharacterized protein